MPLDVMAGLLALVVLVACLAAPFALRIRRAEPEADPYEREFEYRPRRPDVPR
jgi:hypothetical protein